MTKTDGDIDSPLAGLKPGFYISYILPRWGAAVLRPYEFNSPG
jgi:hypothetical protein